MSQTIIPIPQGGTGQGSFVSHSVLLGEGVSPVGSATTGTAGRLFIDQGTADPSFQALTGDVSIASNGVTVVPTVHGVAYPQNPATNTVPVVTGTRQITYELVPNASLLNSAITIGAQTGLAGGGPVSLGSAITVSMGTNVANTLAGYNSSGVFSDVSIGSNLTLVSGVLNATGGGGGAVSSVFGRTGAVVAVAGDYGFSFISGTAAISQGGTGATTAVSARSNLGVSVRSISIYIATPANQTINLDSYAQYPYTISEWDNIQTSSGTLTAALQINGVNVTGISAVTVTSNAQNALASAASSVTIGSNLSLVISAASSPFNLQGTIKIVI